VSRSASAARSRAAASRCAISGGSGGGVGEAGSAGRSPGRRADPDAHRRVLHP
jgi:hypothetical protein